MRRFVDDDEGYLLWLSQHPDGFVLNLMRSGSSGPLVLHRATCRTISGTPAWGRRWTAYCMKLCGDREELAQLARA